ncbi:MAG: hypothetical protein KDA57_18035 [Planctomycetales bacterium]|nr:hypothetical protein [Planctomycetales bacterium]
MKLSRFLVPYLPRLIAGVLAIWASTTSAGSAQAEPAAVLGAADEQAEAPPGTDWVRVLRDAKGQPLALEVAIIRYVPTRLSPQAAAAGSEYVDLIGAVHIGDRSYYRQLNRRFREYDALLFELVAPEGTVVERGRGTSNLNPLGAMQNGMKSMLEVEHQLEQIDYTRPNFVHADLSPAEFLQSMESRDEGFAQLYFRMIGQAVAQQSQQAAQGQSADLDIFSALLSQDRPRMLKIAMAKQFESMESMLVSFSGPEGSTLITERNKRALEVLRQQQAAGKRKLGIFYGAGHLADMHERLVDEFDMKAVEIDWLEAWDLRP